MPRRRDASSTRRDVGRRHTPHLQSKANVFADGHVRVERVTLEDHRDVPLAGWHRVNDVAVDADQSLSWILQASMFSVVDLPHPLGPTR